MQSTKDAVHPSSTKDAATAHSPEETEHPGGFGRTTASPKELEASRPPTGPGESRAGVGAGGGTGAWLPKA